MVSPRAAMLLLTLTGALAACARPPAPPPGLARVASPCIVSAPSWPQPSGHQGNRQQAAGNTQASIRSALSLGVRFIEIDVRESTDGELFLFHDRRLRDGNYRGPDSFQNFPVGIRSARELRSIAVMENGFSGPVVFLREALDDVRAAEACLQLDIKGDSRAVYEKALALAGERGLQSRTFVQCPSLEVLYAVRRYAPEFPVVARVFSEDELAAALPWQPEIVQTDPGMLGSPLVAKAKANGARILVKALGKLDGPTGWESLTKDGADILLTDRPAECIAWASTK